MIPKQAVAALLAQLEDIQGGSGNGVLRLPDGGELSVSNLGKPFWPAVAGTAATARGTTSSAGRTTRRRAGTASGTAGNGVLTKGDLLRHYVRVAPFILPVLADRPLVMKRYPNGVNASPFYQHRAPDKAPAGVRIESVTTGTETRPHLIGGSLTTLLHTAQLASISQDPWFSRVGSTDIIDHVALDLDPPDDLPFAAVLDVARWVRDELVAIGFTGFAKTSGSGGLHVYTPMPPRTPFAAGFLLAQIIATRVASSHPKIATIERSLKSRGRRIYVDYMQNALGKTLASAYSARANDFAGVSTPVTWEEVDEGVSPGDFTVRNFAARLESAGDPWAALRTTKSPDLKDLLPKPEARSRSSRPKAKAVKTGK